MLSQARLPLELRFLLGFFLVVLLPPSTAAKGVGTCLSDRRLTGGVDGHWQLIAGGIVACWLSDGVCTKAAGWGSPCVKIGKH